MGKEAGDDMGAMGGAEEKGGIEGYLEDYQGSLVDLSQWEHHNLPHADGKEFRKISVRVVPDDLLPRVWEALDHGWNGEQELREYLDLMDAVKDTDEGIGGSMTGE